MKEKRKVTVDALKAIAYGETVDFCGLTAAEIDAGKAMASIYGKRLDSRFACLSEYGEGILHVTRKRVTRERR